MQGGHPNPQVAGAWDVADAPVEAGSVCEMVPVPSFADINASVCPSSPFSLAMGDVRKAIAAVEPMMQSRSAATMAAVPKKSFWKNPLS